MDVSAFIDLVTCKSMLEVDLKQKMALHYRIPCLNASRRLSWKAIEPKLISGN